MPVVSWDDMENAHEEASRPAPEGRYIVQVKTATEAVSNEGKHPQVKLVWEIVEGPYKGKVAFETLTFNMDKPVTISMSRATLQMLGFNDLRVWGETDPKLRIEMLKGKKIEADVNVREWNGRITNNIKNKIRALAGATEAGIPAAPPLKGKPAEPVNPLDGI